MQLNRYCEDIQRLQDVLIGFCSVSNELLPDVLIISGLNELYESNQLISLVQLSKILSLLAETVEYIGRRKNAIIPLFVSKYLWNCLL